MAGPCLRPHALGTDPSGDTANPGSRIGIIVRLASGSVGWIITATAISVFDAAAGGISKGNVVISSTDNVSGDNFLAGPVGPEPSSYFPIATNGAVMSYAFDGSNYLVGVENHLTFPTTIGAQMIASNGTKVGSLITTGRSGISTAVAFDGTNYLVVWNDEVGGKDTGTWDSFGQLVSTSGALVGGEITLTSEAGPQMVTSVAFDGANYLAVWVDMQNGTNWDMYGQYISRNGSRVGSKITISTDTGNQMGGVGFANGKYLVLVNNGVIMGQGGISHVDSATGVFVTPPTNPQVQTSDASFGVRTNRFGFTLTGTSGLVIVVEACTNLAHPIWSPLQTNTLTGGSYYFSDPAWTNYPGRFYRLRSP